MKSANRKTYDIFNAMERLRDKDFTCSPDEREYLKAMVALNASDPEAVADYVDLTGDDWAHIYPPLAKPEPISTGKAIDTFLDTYGKSTPEEDALLERMIFNPVAEYGSVLAAMERKENSEPADLPEARSMGDMADMARSINKRSANADDADKRSANADDADKPAKGNEDADPTPAIAKANVKKTTTQSRQKAKTESAPTRTAQPSKGNLSLELAKIFVKQGHFARAHEIISKIILNNPEKSVYFADQLRFLEKLIKIQNAKNSGQ